MHNPESALILQPPPQSLTDLIAPCVRALSPLTAQLYSARLVSFLTWAESNRVDLSWSTIERYIDHLRRAQASVSSINQSIAAVKKLAQFCARANLITPESASLIASVKGPRSTGSRSGNWLSLDQARCLVYGRVGTTGSDTSIRESRNRAIIALLLGCGLRRNEAIHLTIDQLQKRDNRTVIIDLLGKGSKLRTVPVPDWAAEILRDWISRIPPAIPPHNEQSLILRSIDEHGTIGRGLSQTGVWNIVRARAASLGLGAISPHDLRRTFAKLCRRGGAEIDQIQMALGHSSVRTTEIYLGTDLDLDNPACERMGV